MKASLLALAAICAASSGCAGPHLPFTHRHAPIIRHRQEAGEWRLEIRRDRFSEEISCRLFARNHRMSFQGGAVAFRFPRGWNTTHAIYRIDGNEPRHWREDIPALIRIGAPFDQGGIVNPSRGLVWIPRVQIAEASKIAIEARPDRAPVTFHLRGLDGLYQSAVDRGCSPDSRFAG